MLGRGVLLIAALAACGSQARALPVHVALDWPAGKPAPALARAHIKAFRLAGGTESAAPIEAEAGPDGVVLDLGDGVWQVQASTPGYWSQEAEVTLGPHTPPPASVRFALWPAAILHGEILPAEGEPLPQELEIRLTATPASAGDLTVAQAPGPRPGPSPSGAELHCRIDGEIWSCAGPAGLFDVRLEASGYAPRYEWGVSLKAAESTDLDEPSFAERRRSLGAQFVRTARIPQVPAGRVCNRTCNGAAGRGPRQKARRQARRPSPCSSIYVATFRSSACCRAGTCWMSSARPRASSGSCACKRTRKRESILR